MKINSNNYEEFFLLYADDELNAEERTMVEKFAEAHPDLREELYILMQAKLPEEDMLICPYKADLLKQTETGLITENNYSEYFLLYVDNELNPDEQNAVEVFAASYKEKEAELSLLRRTKIAAEEKMVFSNKAILYRTEKKPARTISMRWISIAAAASVLLTGIAVWTNINDNETPETSRPSILAGKADEEKVQEQVKQHTEPLNDVIAEEKHEAAKAVKIEELRNTNSNPVVAKETKVGKPAVNDIQQKTRDEEKSNATLIAAIPAANERKAEAVNNNINNTIADKQTALHDIATSTRNVKPLILDQQAFNGEDKSQPQAEMKNNENVVFLDTDNNEKKPKGKLRGLLRKASRFVDHVTNTGDGEDQSVVRVASFEIAKK
ncbi:MAG: hypothetical protein QM768_09490 [Agriterribacter sp.]